MRLAFFGTPEFSCPALRALLDAGHEIVAVYTQPPRPARRGHKMRRSAVHDLAARRGLAVRTPASLTSDDEQSAFAALGVEAAVVVAYGLILPAPILAAPRLGCLNIHASLLPRWRGAAPIARAMLAGDKETGVTIMLMDEGLDTGPELLKRSLAITDDMTAVDLHDRLADLGAAMIVDALARYAAGRLVPVPQATDGVTYAAKLTRDEARIDWRHSAQQLARQVRALEPWPGSWCRLDGENIHLRDVHPAHGAKTDAAPGTVIATEPLTIACGEGALIIDRLQRPGRKALAAAAFLRGHALGVGDRLT